MFNKTETIYFKGKPGKSKRQTNNIFSKKRYTKFRYKSNNSDEIELNKTELFIINENRYCFR